MDNTDQAAHGRESYPMDIEFEIWWERDSGWGGEKLAEYQLAKAAWKKALHTAEAKVRELGDRLEMSEQARWQYVALYTRMSVAYSRMKSRLEDSSDG